MIEKAQIKGARAQGLALRKGWKEIRKRGSQKGMAKGTGWSVWFYQCHRAVGLHYVLELGARLWFCTRRMWIFWTRSRGMERKAGKEGWKKIEICTCTDWDQKGQNSSSLDLLKDAWGGQGVPTLSSLAQTLPKHCNFKSMAGYHCFQVIWKCIIELQKYRMIWKGH